MMARAPLLSDRQSIGSGSSTGSAGIFLTLQACSQEGRGFFKPPVRVHTQLHLVG